MTTLDRRRFIQLGGVGSAAFGCPGMAQAQSPASAAIAQPSGVPDDRIVRLSGDGLGLNPAQYARLLSRIADKSPISPDSYSLGGIVERLEAECARALGKEQAVFMPTGTLANHLAIRQQALIDHSDSICPPFYSLYGHADCFSTITPSDPGSPISKEAAALVRMT